SASRGEPRAGSTSGGNAGEMPELLQELDHELEPRVFRRRQTQRTLGKRAAAIDDARQAPGHDAEESRDSGQQEHGSERKLDRPWQVAELRHGSVVRGRLAPYAE